MSVVSKIQEEKVSLTTFDRYLDLLPDVRSRIIDEMNPVDRCRFTRTSKLCNEEAKASKKFIYALRFHGPSENKIFISVLYQASETRAVGFQLRFENLQGKKDMTYTSLGAGRDPLWMIKLDRSTDLLDFAIEIFKNELRSCQKILTRLDIRGWNFGRDRMMNVDFEIEKLENLKDMIVDANFDVSKIMTKFGGPLRALNHKDRRQYYPLAHYEQIYQVRDCLLSRDIKLNNEQFLRLTASKININIGELTEMDIYHFIKSWQRGEVRENFKYSRWTLKNSKFDVSKFFQQFGVQMENDKDACVSLEVAQDNDPLKTGKVVKQMDKEWEEICFFVEMPITTRKYYPS